MAKTKKRIDLRILAALAIAVKAHPRLFMDEFI